MNPAKSAGLTKVRHADQNSTWVKRQQDDKPPRFHWRSAFSIHFFIFIDQDTVGGVFSRRSTMQHETQDECPDGQSKKVTPLPKIQIFILLLVMIAEPISSTVIYPFVNQFVKDTGIIHGDARKVGHYAGFLVCEVADFRSARSAWPDFRNLSSSSLNVRQYSNGVAFQIKSVEDQFSFSDPWASLFLFLPLGFRTTFGSFWLHVVLRELSTETWVGCLPAFEFASDAEPTFPGVTKTMMFEVGCVR